MTARSIGEFLPSLKLRLGTKAVICAFLLIGVNTALVVGAAHPAGKVVGLLYVGIPMVQFESMLSHAIQNMAIAAGIAALW